MSRPPVDALRRSSLRAGGDDGLRRPRVATQEGGFLIVVVSGRGPTMHDSTEIFVPLGKLLLAFCLLRHGRLGRRGGATRLRRRLKTLWRRHHLLVARVRYASCRRLTGGRCKHRRPLVGVYGRGVARLRRESTVMLWGEWEGADVVPRLGCGSVLIRRRKGSESVAITSGAVVRRLRGQLELRRKRTLLALLHCPRRLGLLHLPLPLCLNLLLLPRQREELLLRIEFFLECLRPPFQLCFLGAKRIFVAFVAVANAVLLAGIVACNDDATAVIVGYGAR
mmetsp:Transcript_9644/g.28889  ORF Transcript_9644/g.28889 Transcript_9644/m.28889 type:complete len:280 (-) Transcript_9644:2419-3258(-)